MTDRAIFGRTLRARRRAWIGWSLALAALNALVVGVYPSLSNQPGIAEFVEELPEFFRQITGLTGGLDFFSATGYLNSRVMTTGLPIVLMIFLIGAGSQELAGEEGDGTLDLLLAQPVPRSRILLRKYAALVVLLGGVSVVGLVSVLALVAVVGMEVGLGGIVSVALSVTAMSLAYGTLGFAIGAATGKRTVAVAVAAGVVLASYVLWGLAPLVSWLQWSQRLTLFFWAFAGQPILNGIQPGNLLLLLAVSGITLGAGLSGFCRRDIGV